MAALEAEADREIHGQLPEVDLNRLKVARTMVDETLRLYPPTALLARQNVEVDSIGGYAIPPGSMVMLVPYRVHRYPGIWDDPEKFDPGRFSADAPVRARSAYIPFASGSRVCMGNSFALLEMVLTFAMVTARYRLTLFEPGEIACEFSGTTRPRRALRMKIVER